MSGPHFPGLGSGAPGSPSPASSTGGFPGLPLATPSNAFADLGPAGMGDGSVGGAGEAGPPLVLFGAAVVSPLITVPLLFMDGWAWHVFGWAVSTLLTAALLIIGTLQDTRRRASIYYLRRDGLVRSLRGGALGLALLAAAAHAWLFADWFARLPMFAA